MSWLTKGFKTVGVHMLRQPKKLQTVELKTSQIKRGLQLENRTTMFTTLMDRISTRDIRFPNQRLELQRVQHLWLTEVRREFIVGSGESFDE